MKHVRSATLLAVLAAGACLSPREDTSAFFLLSPTPSRISAVTPIDVVVGLGPIEIPAYLDRSQIVVRLSDNQVALSDSDRWAEPIAANLHRTLEENLAALLPGAAFVDYPWYASEAPDHAVAITFRRFEADAAGTVVLDATWEVTSATNEEARATRIEEPAGAAGSEAAVAAQSRALTRLAEEIAAAVRRAAAER